HVLGVGHLLQAQTVNGLAVGDSDHLVALHDIQADTCNTGVGLVVDEHILAVVLAVGHRDVRVVAVAVEELGALAHDRPALVGDAPAGSRIDVEYRNTHQLAHRRNTQHAHFTLVATAPETDVVIQFTGGHMVFQLGILDRCRPGFAAHHRRTQTRSTHRGSTGTGHGCGAEEATATQAGFFHLVIGFLAVRHGVSPWEGDFSFSLLSARIHLDYRDQLRVGRSRLVTLSLLLLGDKRGTLVLVVVGHLAIQTVVALVGIDPSIRVDGLDLAFIGAQLARL